MGAAGLEHVLVLTDDIEGTVAFWRAALDLRVAERPPLPFPGAWLAADGPACVHVADRAAYAAHAQSIGVTASSPGASTGALDHVAFTTTDHAAVTARLAGAGIAAVPNDVPGGIRQLFVRDPNGVTVEINVKPA